MDCSRGRILHQLPALVGVALLEATGHTLTAQTVPDLIPMDITVPASAFIGDTITITVAFRNGGNGSAAAPWSATIYLSSDSIITRTDVNSGQIGLGSTSDFSSPSKAASPIFFTIDASKGSTCGITASYDLYCWGLNDEGRLGIGVVGDRATPVAALGGLKFASVAVGYHHSRGLTTAHLLYCWGKSVSGQLGNGTTNRVMIPTRVSGQ
jgi:alpha-tubulin suppressor-like RCC1 family protein